MDHKELIKRGAAVVEAAKKAGADVAEAIVIRRSELSVRVRLGETEKVQEADSYAVGLRVMVEGRSATTHTSDPTDTGRQTMVEDALELARLSEADEFSAPPDASELAKDFPELDLFDEKTASIGAAQAETWAKEAEQAALDHDKRITNSEGGSFSRTRNAMALVTATGFQGSFAGSYASASVAPLADDEGGKKRNGVYWDARRYFDEMMSPEAVGQEAARRTVVKLGAKKIETMEVPVVFDPDAGRALLSLVFSCAQGGAIYKRSSYLTDKVGEKIASDLVTIIDDPLIVRGPGSRPFDGEGLASRANTVVEDGVLKTYLLDTYSGRKLGQQSTGSAARGLAGRPSVSPTNFMMQPGKTTRQSVLRGVKRGFYVTSMMGFGFNAVTGDFSRGAEGFWIEDGELSYPVGEVTVSANFLDLWKNIDAVGDDVDTRARYACPTFRVSKMTVAGSG